MNKKLIGTKYIFIDANNLCYIAFHGIPDELSSKERQTAVLFGFFNKLTRIARECGSGKFVFFFDSRKSYRKRIQPDYKNRGEKLTQLERDQKKLLYEQISILRDELKNLDYPVFHYGGYEADDLIAMAKIKYSSLVKTIVSTDHDLYQLVDYRTFQLSPVTFKVMTHDEMTNTWNCTGLWWAHVKAWAGCASDNIKGIEGVGEKTAASFITGKLKGKTTATALKFQLPANIKKYESNLKLVMLPFEGRSVDVTFEPYSVLKKLDFIRFFEKYEFNSFLKRFTAIAKLYGLE